MVIKHCHWKFSAALVLLGLYVEPSLITSVAHWDEASCFNSESKIDEYI